MFMRIQKILNEQQLKAVCDVIADTNRGLTKTELSRLLEQCQIQLVDDGKSSNGYTYTIGLNKRDWLYNCFVNEINKRHTFERIYLFIVFIIEPFTTRSRNIASRITYERIIMMLYLKRLRV